eukprot:g11292.t1
MASASAAARYQQTTKSREAYEAQQLAFLHRPISSSAPRRSRPQSAGSAGWSGSRERGGSSKSVAGFPNPPSCPPPLYHRSSSRPVGGGGAPGRGASLDTATPPAPSLAATNANGGGVRLGKPRTRVRPSSANARVYGRPGAGQGVGGDGGGGPPPGSAAASVPRRVHVPRQSAGYGIDTTTGDDGKVQAGDSRGQYRSPSPAPAKAGSRPASPARIRTPLRPKSAAVRRSDNVTPPSPTTASRESSGVKVDHQAEGDGKPQHTLNGSGCRAAEAPPSTFTGKEPSADDSATGRAEFRGSEHREGGSSAQRAQHRPRPRSAVARVETTPHHGKAAPPVPQSATAAARAAGVVSSKLKAAAAVVASATYRGSRGDASRGAGCGTRTSGGKVGRTRVAPRPQSAATRRTAVTGTYGQSQRGSMERVMARIFQQNRNWAGDHGREKGAAEGYTKATSCRQARRPHSARTRVSSSMGAARQSHPYPQPKPQMWAPTAPAQSSSALLTAAANAAGAAAEVATAAATRSTTPRAGGTHSKAARGDDAGAAALAAAAVAATGRGGAYARLFDMKHPGAHRRVGVDPLDGFKKDHYRSASAAVVDSGGAEKGAAGNAGGLKAGRRGQGAGARGVDVSKPVKTRGEGNDVENQATVSTANTGSLTPQEGSSSAEGGRTVGEGGVCVPPPVEPLTKASAECCSPQERLYLRRLMLDLQGSARSSLDFYRLGKVVGEGSFAQVRVAWHKLTGQRVAVKTYEKAKIKDENQWKRISQEVKLMEKLNHPRVIRLFETAESSKRIHLVMEYANGGNLCSYVKRRKRLDEGEARRILQQLLEGVEYMHGSDIVHRDIKLENVLLGGSDRTNAKLVDFGFSAHVKNRRLLHVFCGTPSYMAPEIIKRQEYEGKPVDIWSLGVVLYAMLCGCFPFSGPRYPELYKNIAKGVFRLPDWLSPTASSLVRGMLVTNPTQRFTLRQVCAHPWVAPSRAIGRVSTGNQYRSADGRSSPLPSDNSGGGGRISPVPPRTESFHISNDPNRDVCAASVKKMEAFGADGEEITRQVLARRHSCLTTTFYLLKNELSASGGAATTRRSSACSPISSTARPRSATIRPGSASAIGRSSDGGAGGTGGAKRRSGGGSSGADSMTISRSPQRALAA